MNWLYAESPGAKRALSHTSTLRALDVTLGCKPADLSVPQSDHAEPSSGLVVRHEVLVKLVLEHVPVLLFLSSQIGKQASQ
jgi:hypothetical protein